MALKMHAAVVEQFGKPLALLERNISTPGPGQILVKTEACGVWCAGITTYKGIKETAAKPGEWIAISGVGGLGHLAIQYAKAKELLVCAIDIDDGKLAHAKRLGADLVIKAKTGDPAAVLEEGNRRRSSWRSDYGAFAHRIQARRWHDPEAWHLRPSRAAAGRIPGSAFRCGGELQPSAVRSSARARICPKRSLSLRRARSKPISSCSPYLQSIKSSTGSSRAMCRHAWSLTSREAS